MKHTRKISALGLSSILLLFFVFSCGTSSTTITGTWERQDIPRNYENVLVAALTSRVGVKSTVENHITQTLSEEGIQASQSVELLPPKFIEDENQRQSILNAIKSDGIDAILTVSLIDSDTETRYSRGAVSYAPYPAFGYYGNFWRYYNHWYPQFHSPGYYSEDKIYFIETNLYDAETEDLIWSAQSETYNPVSLESFSEGFAEEIVERLVEDGIM